MRFAAPGRSLFLALLPVLVTVGAVFLTTGAQLATLPLFVHQTLGFGAGVVGTIAGAQFVAALASRIWAGRMSDRLGPRRVMLTGLGLAMASGAACLGAVALQGAPLAAVLVLLAGRALLGAGEGFIITGGQSWGLAMAGQSRAAAVIGWVGTALYVALAAGGPLGGWLWVQSGFFGVALMTLLIPAATVLIVLPQRDARAPIAQTGTTFPILRSVLVPGMTAGLAGLAYAAMAFFSALLFLGRDWQPTWAPFSAFAIALVAVRVVAGHLPDRLGTRTTVWIFLCVQIVGLSGLALAPGRDLAILASFIAGTGYAFIYPALGREAVSRVPAEGTGRAVAYYSAFFDLTMALAGLVLGQIAEHAGMPFVFAAAVAASALSLGLILLTPRRPPRGA